jgi:hypothetical protein
MRHAISKTKQLSSIPNIVSIVRRAPSICRIAQTAPQKFHSRTPVTHHLLCLTPEQRCFSSFLLPLLSLLHMTFLHLDTSSTNPQMTSALSHPVGLGC